MTHPFPDTLVAQRNKLATPANPESKIPCTPQSKNIARLAGKTGRSSLPIKTFPRQITGTHLITNNSESEIRHLQSPSG